MVRFKNTSLPAIPPEVRCFRYVFGVQILPQQVFGSLGKMIQKKVDTNGHFSGFEFEFFHLEFHGVCLNCWIFSWIRSTIL